MSDPPVAIEELENRIADAIRAVGETTESLDMLSRLAARTPRWFRAHRLMEHCVDPKTPVLMHDFAWKRAGDLRPGDETIAFDEEPTKRSGPVKWRYSKVVSNHEYPMEAWLVLLSDGASLIVSGEHRWKSGAGDPGGGHGRKWIYTKNLKPGLSKVARYTKLWAIDFSHDAGYLAGLFDGEGNIAKSSMQPAFAQRPNAVLALGLEKLSKLNFDFSVYPVSKGQGKGDCVDVRIKGGLAEYMRFLGSVRPARLLENATLPRARLSVVATPTVTGIVLLGTRPLSVLSTESKTFIAAGFGAHNSIPSPSSITECRLKLWYRARGRERDQELPLIWQLRRAMGIVSEAYWLAVLEETGLRPRFPNKVVPCSERMVAHPDAHIDDWLVEFKSTTGFGYRKLIETPAGVAVVERGHYAQAQLNCFAAKKEWCLYLSAAPDPGMLQSLQRQKKKHGPVYELRPFYLEWIRRNDAEVQSLLERAEVIAEDIERDEPPPREHGAVEFKPDGYRTFPCGYCTHLSKCQEQYGKYADTFDVE